MNGVSRSSWDTVLPGGVASCCPQARVCGVQGKAASQLIESELGGPQMPDPSELFGFYCGGSGRPLPGLPDGAVSQLSPGFGGAPLKRAQCDVEVGGPAHAVPAVYNAFPSLCAPTKLLKHTGLDQRPQQSDCSPIQIKPSLTPLSSFCHLRVPVSAYVASECNDVFTYLCHYLT